MTRMTSDIEALTVLFQEGLVNFAVQAMTLVVITVYLLILNPTLALVCLVVVIPVNVVFTLWFRRVSRVGTYGSRDRIADVLADLSESLAGIRIIAAFNRQGHSTAAMTGLWAPTTKRTSIPVGLRLSSVQVPRR